MSIRPSIGIFGCTTGGAFEDDDDYHGRTLVICWLGWMLEFSIARRGA